MAYDGSLKFDTQIDTTGFKSGTNTIKSQANGLKSTILSLGKTIGLVFGVTQLIRFGKQAIDTASDLTEVQNVVDTAFGDMAYKMEDFAKTSIQTFGISKLAAKQTGSTFMAMARGMGIAMGTSSDMAIALTGLSADMSSFYNVSQDVASTALKSIFTGETETLKQFGIVMTQANLQAFAYSKGIKQDVADMDQATITQLRYAYVMQQTSLAQGDFAKTSDSWANQTRVLSERWKEFLSLLGQGLIQVLSPVVRFLNTALSYMISMAGTVGEILSTIFGINLDITKSTESITTGAEDAAGGYNDLGDAAKDAGKQAQKAVAPFDQLNQVASESASADTSINVPGIEIESGKAPDKVDNAVVKSFKDLDGAIKPALDSLKKFKETLEPIGKFVFDNLKSLYNDTLKPIGKWVLGKGLPALIDAGSKLIGSINWDALSKSISNFNKAIAPLAIQVGQGFIYFVQTLTDILSPILATTTDLLAKALNGLASAIKLVPADAAISLGGAIGGLVTAILLFKGAEIVVSIIKNIKDGLETAIITLMVYPWSAVALGIAALAGAVLAWDKARFNNSDVGLFIASVNEVLQSAKDYDAEVDEMVKKSDERKAAIETQYGGIEILADKYFELADKANKTNAEYELQKTYAKELCDETTGIPALTQYIDTQTGAYSGTKEEIIGLIDKTKEYYLVQAAQEDLIEIAKQQYEGEKTLDDLEQQRVDTAEMIRKKTGELEDANNRAGSATRNMTGEQKNAVLESIKLEGDLNKLKGTYNNIVDQMNDTKDSQDELSKKWDEATSYISDYADTATTKINGMSDATDEALGKVKKNIEGFVLPHLKVGIDIDDSGITAVTAKYAGLSPGKISAYASGTVVPANYGSFLGILGDNKRETEVVSPLSTIKQALREELGDLGGMGSGEGTINLNVYLDGRQIHSEVVKQDKTYRKQTGRSAFAY